MADQVAEVKSKVDIVHVVGSRVNLKQAGKYSKGLCPFHSEKTPSFFVSPELQVYKCFGCGRSGDVFTFLEEYEGLSFREALEMLAERVGVKLESYQPSQSELETGRWYEVLDLAKEYYHYILEKHPAGAKAREYLKKRGVDEGLMQKFSLGWAPESWDGLHKYLVGKKKYQPEELVAVGMVSAGQRGGYYDRFRGRVMFPLADFRGRIVGFSGRIIEEKEKEAKYINTPETKLYHKRELLYGIEITRSMIRKKDAVYVVEGEFDVISSFAVGVMNVVGIKGSALTPEQIRLLLRLTRNVVLCLDADAAGDEAMRRGIEVADREGMNVGVVEVVGGKDPDEVARAKPQEWKRQVKEAKSVYEYLVESALKRHDVGSGVGKKRVVEELAPMLSKISNSVEQAHYVGKVAEALKVGEEAVRAEMDKAARKKAVGRVEEAEVEAEPTLTREETLERYVWGLALQLTGEEFNRGWAQVRVLEWQQQGFGRLAKLVEEHLKDGGKQAFAVGTLVSKLPPELAGLVSRVYLDEEMVNTIEMEERMAELERAVAELRLLKKREAMKRLTREIATLEQESELSEAEERALVEKQAEFSRLIAALAEERR